LGNAKGAEMKNMYSHDRFLRGAAISSGIFVFCVLFAFGYFRAVFVAPMGTEVHVSESPLLPETWHTYRAEAWSVGYPDAYHSEERKEERAVFFIPGADDADVTYFSVHEDVRSLQEIMIARRGEGYAEPVDVMIANYPGVIYTLGTGRVEFFIAYHSTVYVLTSDDPNDGDIRTMFATFSFL
jgi:hypothetical protein